MTNNKIVPEFKEILDKRVNPNNQRKYKRKEN